MELRRIDEQTLQLTLTEAELGALQAGLAETNEALSDWEFQTRTGLTRDEWHAIRDDLRAARRELGS